MYSGTLLSNAKKLAEITELTANNDNCVVLKVKDRHELDLISLGVFNGNETMFRLTKGDTITCTIFRADKNPFSWSWGAKGYTRVTDRVSTLGRIVQVCIEQVYKIKCKY